jgi:hypothetical protein
MQPAIRFGPGEKAHRVQDFGVESVGRRQRAEDASDDGARRIGESVLGEADRRDKAGLRLGGETAGGNQYESEDYAQQ